MDLKQSAPAVWALGSQTTQHQKLPSLWVISPIATSLPFHNWLKSFLFHINQNVNQFPWWTNWNSLFQVRTRSGSFTKGSRLKAGAFTWSGPSKSTRATFATWRSHSCCSSRELITCWSRPTKMYMSSKKTWLGLKQPKCLRSQAKRLITSPWQLLLYTSDQLWSPQQQKSLALWCLFLQTQKWFAKLWNSCSLKT